MQIRTQILKFAKTARKIELLAYFCKIFSNFVRNK